MDDAKPPSLLSELRALDRSQRAVCIASLLGWSLDAFDFFLLVFVMRAIAADFHTGVKEVAYAITLTLMFRPLGALVFGRLADRYGRRPILMLDIVMYSVFEFASAFAPSLTALLVLRALFGFAMGGEWGIGSSLVMESVPPRCRGIISGILQEGYTLGYLLAAAVYTLFFDYVGWRGLFMIGVAPALLVLYIRVSVKESPSWEERQRKTGTRVGFLVSLRQHWKRFCYVILLMTGFNFFSHGTQDLYPTFLQAQHHLSTHQVGLIAMVANCGAILGGICFGIYSQRAGRRKAIVIAALLALPIVPLWAFASTPLLLGLGAFLLQIAVQGAWGVIPAHLNELSPPDLRATFPGFAYQLGNLLASSNAIFQAKLAADHGGNYAFALAVIASVTAVAIMIIASLGKENKEIVL